MITALREIFELHRPQVVFHSAALKHLPLLEQYPDEGWKANVIGTQHLLELSAEFQVDKFVNMYRQGRKPIERLWANEASHRAIHCLVRTACRRHLPLRAVRKRPRLAWLDASQSSSSRSSVAGPSRSLTRKSLPEASELVIQAGAIGSDGEVLVLDMGELVRILDVARRLVTHSGEDIESTFTGLRPNEKFHEDLFSENESGLRPHHPLISHVAVPPFTPNDLEPILEMNGGTGGAPAPGPNEPAVQKGIIT